MIIKTDTALAIMDSLADETAVRVYGPRDKLLAIGVVVRAFKNGFRVRLRNGWRSEFGKDEVTFFYKDGCEVVFTT